MTLEEAKAIIDALVTLRNSATDEQALKASALYPKWKVGIAYQKDERVLYNDILYKMLSCFTSIFAKATDKSLLSFDSFDWSSLCSL